MKLHLPDAARSEGESRMHHAIAIKTGKGPGLHPIGFRVVQAEMPETKPTPYEPPFPHAAVKQSTEGVLQGPDLSKPYYRTRPLFPNLRGQSMRSEEHTSEL